MEAGGPNIASIVFAVIGIAVLLASGWWTDRTYRRFDRLPGHYSLTGEATRLDPRPVTAWLIPVVFSLAIAGIAVFVVLTPPDKFNSDPSLPLFLTPLLLIAVQGFLLALLRRWASRQP